MLHWLQRRTGVPFATLALARPIPFPWYVLIGSVITFAVGYSSSLLLRDRRRMNAACPKALISQVLTRQSKPRFRAISASATRRDRRGHHHRQRHLPGSSRDDAGGRLGAAGLSGMDRRRRALVRGRHHLCRTGRHEAASRRRIRLHPRRLRAAAWISLCLDMVRHRQAGFDCDHHDRIRAHPRHVSGAGVLQSGCDPSPFAHHLWPIRRHRCGGVHHLR